MCSSLFSRIQNILYCFLFNQLSRRCYRSLHLLLQDSSPVQHFLLSQQKSVISKILGSEKISFKTFENAKKLIKNANYDLTTQNLENRLVNYNFERERKLRKGTGKLPWNIFGPQNGGKTEFEFKKNSKNETGIIAQLGMLSQELEIVNHFSCLFV